jgi:hypothetical protein
MIISGYTDSRLKDVSTYSKTQPYQVGVNGVIDVVYDTSPVPRAKFVSYIIDDIRYDTYINTPLFFGKDLFINTNTIYFFNSTGFTQQEINVIKREVEMGISEPPKVESEIFIERQSSSVFERHLRMGEITTLEQLEEYRNGYYNIFNLE